MGKGRLDGGILSYPRFMSLREKTRAVHGMRSDSRRPCSPPSGASLCLILLQLPCYIRYRNVETRVDGPIMSCLDNPPGRRAAGRDKQDAHGGCKLPFPMVFAGNMH